jgi:hypothetical protein
MTENFYYHTESFETEEFAQKCAKRLDGVSIPVQEWETLVETKTDPSDFFDTAFTDGREGPNYHETVVEYDVPYEEMNERSREREIEHLNETRGQFYTVILRLDDGNNEQICSALIEIRGAATREKVEYYVEELVSQRVDVPTDTE